MRSSALIHICEKKGADQLHDNRTADQPLCFHFTDNTIPLLPDPKFHSSSSFLWQYSPVCVGPGRNFEDRFSNGAAHISLNKCTRYTTIHEYLTS